MILWLKEPPRTFLLLLHLHFIFVYLHFHFWSSFVDVLHSHLLLLLDYRRVFTPILYTFSSAHRRIIRNTFIFNYSVIFLPRTLRFWVAIFYPQAFFTLRSFTNIFDSTRVYQGFPGSRQFFLQVWRASYWSLKRRPGPSVCMIHSNPQSSYLERFNLNSTIY